MRILVIEDEVKAARFLQKGLSEAGLTVDVVHDGDEGLVAADTGAYDLLIVDVALPGLDGFSIVRELRRRGRATPVIQLTARDAVQDRVEGIEAGADVYLVKPFSFSELLAYVRTLPRRKSDTAAPRLRVGDLELDLVRRRAVRGEHVLDLTAKEFNLLALLVRRQGQVLGRAVIAEEVWGLNYDPGTNVVDVHIRRLRAKVDDPFERKLIWTVRGAGYVLEVRA